MFGRSVRVTRRGHPSLTHLITQPDVGREARLPAKVSMAECLLLGSGSYNRELCLYSPVLPQSLLILSRLPATPAALWFSSSLPLTPAPCAREDRSAPPLRARWFGTRSSAFLLTLTPRESPAPMAAWLGECARVDVKGPGQASLGSVWSVC